MMHATLMAMTAGLPMRIIPINGHPYLERYFVGINKAGMQTWLHRFITGDPDRYMHSHPWRAKATVLVGGYTERRCTLVDKMPCGVVTQLTLGPGDINFIDKSTLHQLIVVEPNTWTLMQVMPGWDTEWYFLDDEGKQMTMKKRHGSDHAAPWWTEYGARK